MAKTTTATPKKAPTDSEADRLAAFFTPLSFMPRAVADEQAVEHWTDLSRSAVERLGELREEMDRFVTARLERDLDYGRTLVSCRSPQDLVTAYTNFAGAAFADYSGEAVKLVRLAGEMNMLNLQACAELAGAVSAGEGRMPEKSREKAPEQTKDSAKDDSQTVLAAE